MKHFAIANRLYSYSGDIHSEFDIDKNKTYLCRLDYLNCVSVIGENAQTFLQGQLSCDVTKVDNTHFCMGLLCSLKGRIIAMMDVIRCHDYQLIVEKDITDRTLSVLQKAAMISRVQLKASKKYSVLGIIGSVSQLDLPIDAPAQGHNLSQNETACLYQIAENMHILLVENATADSLISANSQSIKGSILWHYLSLIHNRPSIYPETQGEFLPHRLNLHLQPGVISFNKGCFRGQEIVARTHYRAKLKHSYHTYTTTELPQLGGKIMKDNSEIGEIIDYSPINDHQFLIAASLKKNKD